MTVREAAVTATDTVLNFDANIILWVVGFFAAWALITTLVGGAR